MTRPTSRAVRHAAWAVLLLCAALPGLAFAADPGMSIGLPAMTVKQASGVHQMAILRGRGRQQLIDHLPIDRMQRVALLRRGDLRHGPCSPGCCVG